MADLRAAMRAQVQPGPADRSMCSPKVAATWYEVDANNT